MVCKLIDTRYNLQLATTYLNITELFICGLSSPPPLTNQVSNQLGPQAVMIRELACLTGILIPVYLVINSDSLFNVSSDTRFLLPATAIYYCYAHIAFFSSFFLSLL
uniref:Uncharacterized protein n=1 Tax=Cacopsylla melanoneura TaxID=428564 RepID=A0A8D9BG05_9HEMI